MNGGKPMKSDNLTYADNEWKRIDLTWSEDGSTVPDPEVYEHRLAPARGVVAGLLLSIPIWLGIIAVVRWAVSRG